MVGKHTGRRRKGARWVEGGKGGGGGEVGRKQLIFYFFTFFFAFFFALYFDRFRLKNLSIRELVLQIGGLLGAWEEEGQGEEEEGLLTSYLDKKRSPPTY